MVQIRPFKGLLYNKDKVKNISAVIAPPYDVISPQEQRELYKRSPYNIVRLILGNEFAKDNRSRNRYTRAAGYLKNWQDKGILGRDERDVFYIYAQSYLCQSKKRTRYGLIALLKLEDFASGKVLPHEVTSGKPKADRSRLLKTVKANLSPIFTIFPDDKKQITSALIKRAKAKPYFTFKHKGVEERLWRLSDKKVINKISRIFKAKTIFIADGHHRYEAALELKHIYGYIMIYLVGLNEEGLTILPTHRLVKMPYKIKLEGLIKKLGKFFKVQKVNGRLAMFKEMAKQSKNNKIFGLFAGGKNYFILKLNKLGENTQVLENLDVSVLHDLIFKNALNIESAKFDPKVITYTRDEDFAFKSVKKSEFDLAFFLNPTKLSEVKNIALAKLKMPHKSTYFYPKPLSGLVINKFNQR